MIRFLLATFFGCLLLGSTAHAGRGGTWVFEWLTCMETAESAGVPREQARTQCSQDLTTAELDLDAAVLERSSGQDAAWAHAWLTCMDAAERAELPQEQARLQCMQLVPAEALP